MQDYPQSSFKELKTAITIDFSTVIAVFINDFCPIIRILVPDVKESVRLKRFNPLLTFGELGSTTSFLQSILLTFLHTGISG